MRYRLLAALVEIHSSRTSCSIFDRFTDSWQRPIAMPLVVFESGEGPAVQALGSGGERLVDLCDDLRAPVPFSCRSASCGTCRIDVLEGADLLDPPSADELDVLVLFGDDPTQRRLACQARVRAGVGTLRVRPCTDETGG